MINKIDFLAAIGLVLFGLFLLIQLVCQYYRYKAALLIISKMRGYETSKENGPWTIAKEALNPAAQQAGASEDK